VHVQGKVAVDPSARRYHGLMGRGRLLVTLVVFLAAVTVIAPAASGEETHVYSVSLTIAVDRAAHKLGGSILTEAPSEFCESSTVRVRKATPGKDDIAGRIFPVAGEWHFRSPKALRGERVYAEVLPYHLPSRPVECLGARSRTVTAP